MVGDDEPEVPGDRQQPGNPAGRPGAVEEHDGIAGSGGENHGVDPVDVETCLLKPSVIRCRGRHAVSLWRAAPEVVHRNGRPASRSGPSPGSGDRPAADTRSRGISKRRSFFPPPRRCPDRAPPLDRDFARRAFTVGIRGPVGSGKTALVLALCRALRDSLRLGVVTNDIFTREDAEFLTRHAALPPAQIRAVETGGCPHAAIREDISTNLLALEDLMAHVRPELLLVESGGDNLAAQYSRELVDYTIYVIDVAGGDKVPRKGGPGITQSDLLVINKTDLAPHVGADLSVMARR